MRASVRVAALSELPVGYIWTHDSVKTSPSQHAQLMPSL